VPAWFYAKPLWAGLSIMTMWLAVLFVGVLGGNIVSSTPGGTSTSVPVVLTLVPFVLAGTIGVARRGFKDAAGDHGEPRDTSPMRPMTPRATPRR